MLAHMGGWVRMPRHGKGTEKGRPTSCASTLCHAEVPIREVRQSGRTPAKVCRPSSPSSALGRSGARHTPVTGACKADRRRYLWLCIGMKRAHRSRPTGPTTHQFSTQRQDGYPTRHGTPSSPSPISHVLPDGVSRDHRSYQAERAQNLS